MKLQQARVFVTGGASGLGRRFALDLAQAGARVGICDVDDEALARVAADAAEEGLDLWTAQANVASEPEVQKLFMDFAAAHDGIDALVNNAGITRDALLCRKREDRLETMSLAQWQQVIDVNLTGVFLCSREAAQHMIRGGRGGAIVSLSSISRHGNVGQLNYTASKAGVAAMTVVLAKELARYGIRAAAIAPGYTLTEMTQAIREDVRKKIVDGIPLQRMADMAEISHTLRFILENDYVTGRVIEVDGGLRL